MHQHIGSPRTKPLAAAGTVYGFVERLSGEFREIIVPAFL